MATTQNIFSSQGRGATNLFSDEQDTYNQMINDGLDDTTAKSLITRKRKTLLKDISQEEASVLSKMREDGIDSETAVKVINKNRYKNLPLYKKALKVPFDLGVGAASLATEQVGNILDFTTGGQFDFKQQGQEASEIGRRATGDSGTFQTGRNILGTGEMFAVSPTKLAPSLLGRTAQGAAVGGIIGAGEPILEKGADVTPGEIIKGGAIGATVGAVATPLLEKAVIPAIASTVRKGIKYGTAGIKGGVQGAGKSIIRDVKRPFTKAEGLAPEKAANISTKANRFTAPQEKKFLDMTGESSGEFATKRGMTKVGDEAVEESAKFYKSSLKEADEGLALINGKFTDKSKNYMGNMLDDLDVRLTNTLNKDSKKVSLLNQKYKAEGLSMAEVNEIKRIYSRNYKYNFLEAGGEAAQRSTNLQNGVREWQFQVAKEAGFKNLGQINKNTQAWRAYLDNLGKSQARKGTNNEVSLTDWVALSGGEPTNLALYLGKRTLGHSKVKGAIIKGLSKQTKEPVIKAKRLTIARTRAKKELAKKQLLLPKGKTKAPTRTQIEPSKKPIKLKAKTEANIKTTKSKPSKPTVVSKEGAKKEAQRLKSLTKTKDDTNNNILPSGRTDSTIQSVKPKVLKTSKKVVKKPVVKKVNKKDVLNITKNLTEKNIPTIANKIAKELGVKAQEVAEIIKAHIKKYGKEFKNKLGNLVDDIADKTGARMKFVDDSGTGISGKVDDKTVLQYSLDSQIPKEATIKTIPLNKIKGTDYLDLDKALKSNKKLTIKQAEEIISPTDEFLPNKPVSNAIEVVDNGDGTYNLFGGNHRVTQALINGDREIIAGSTKWSGKQGESIEAFLSKNFSKTTPTKSAGLIEEASYIPKMKAQAKIPQNFKKPKKLYRGVSEATDKSKRSELGFALLGKGLYTTPDKSFAKKYGKVIEFTPDEAFPKNPLVIERPFGPAPDALKNWLLDNTGLRHISEFHKLHGEDYSKFLKELGYDGVYIGDEVVKY